MSPKRKASSSSEQGGGDEHGASSPSCPSCTRSLDVYEGHNPVKQGTGFCVNCGTRYPITN